MWFLDYNIQEKEEGMKGQIPNGFFTKPCSEKEFEFISKYVDSDKKHSDFPIPDFLQLPEEYIELLNYSKSGIIVNEEREFGFFDIETIREYYMNYGFIIYAPYLLPIAFNGGGTFYVYNFAENIESPKIYGIHSSCVGDDQLTCFLGNTLHEVLSKTISIDDEIDEQNDATKLDDDKKRKNWLIEKRFELNSRLREIKEKRNNGEIDLKTFIKTKREIEQKLNGLE